MQYSKRFLTVNKFAEESGLSKYAIRNGIKNGTIPSFPSGNRFLIDTEKFEEQQSRGVVNG